MRSPTSLRRRERRWTQRLINSQIFCTRPNGAGVCGRDCRHVGGLVGGVGRSSPLVDDLATVVRSGDWPAAYAVADRLSWASRSRLAVARHPRVGRVSTNVPQINRSARRRYPRRLTVGQPGSGLREPYRRLLPASGQITGSSGTTTISPARAREQGPKVPRRGRMSPGGAAACPRDRIADVAAMSASEPMTASLPVLRVNSHAACTLGPIEPGGRSRPASSPGVSAKPALLGCSPAGVDAVDIGGDDQQLGIELLGEERGREVLVDHSLDAVQLAVLVVRRRDAPAACTDHDRAVLDKVCGSPRISKMRLGFGLATTRRKLSPSGAMVQPPTAARRSASGVCRRPARSVWSGGRTRGRRDRPRSWSTASPVVDRRVAGCPVPAR